MDVSYNLSLLLRKHVKVLKIHDKNKLLRGRLLVFGVGPLSVILSLVFIVGVLDGQSRLDKTCVMSIWDREAWW
ncbi:unnamed protein product, partial [Prunus brigantina]